MLVKARGVLWEGENTNLKEKQRFTLKISLACKAGARECPCSPAEVCLPGTRCLCPLLQHPGALEGPFIPGYRCRCGLGSEEVVHGKANKEKAAACGRAAEGWAGREGSGLSPRRGNPASPGAPEPALPAPAAPAQLRCSPAAPPCCNRAQSSAGKRLPWAFPSFLWISERVFLERKRERGSNQPRLCFCGNGCLFCLKSS